MHTITIRTLFRKLVAVTLTLALVLTSLTWPSMSVSADSNNVSAVLGGTVVNNGVEPRAGDGSSGPVTGTLDGKGYWQTDKDSGSTAADKILYLYMNINDDYLYNNVSDAVEIEVEYYDEGNGQFLIQYKSQSGDYASTPVFKYGNTKNWKKHIFKIADGVFANDLNDDDFRISIEGGGINYNSNADLKLASVAVTKIAAQPTKNVVSVTLGDSVNADGITPRGGDSPDDLITGTVVGQTYWETNKANTDVGTLFFYMDLDSDFTQNINDNNVEVEVEYYDEGNGHILFQYDSQSEAFRTAPILVYGNTKTWKKHTFNLDDAMFSKRTNGSDFRIGVDSPIAVPLKVHAIKVTKIPKQNNDEASVKLGNDIVNNGVTPRAGDSIDAPTTGEIEGKGYWKSNRQTSEGAHLYFYMNVADSYLYNNNDYDVWVTVEYLDRDNGSISLQYDSKTEAFKEATSLNYGNSGKWKKGTFKLSDALFTNRTNGADFRIGIAGSGIPDNNPDMYISSVSIKKVPRLTIDRQTAVQTTNYATEDVVIADYNVKNFGAAGDGQKDDTDVIQKVLTAAGLNGGGVVYIPSGNYRVTGHLVIPSGVTLRGDRPASSGTNEPVVGTILQAYEGRGEESGISFIQLKPSSGVTNLSVWYPEQSIDQPTPYPWTFEQLPGDNATIENVTLVNSYKGVKVGPEWNELHTIKSLKGTALHTGIFLDFTTDIGRLEGVTLTPDVWANSGLSGSPSRTALFNYMTSHAEGIVMGRSDWEYMYDIHISGFKTGIRVTTRTNSNETANAQMYRVQVTDTNVALKIEGVNEFGLLITDSTFEANTGVDPISIYLTSGFQTIVQFNNVTVGGTPKYAVKNEGAGVVSFENSNIKNANIPADRHAIELAGGSIILGQTTFERAGHHLKLEKSVKEVLSTNSGYAEQLDVTDNSISAELKVKNNVNMAIDNLPSFVNVADIKKPKPATAQLFDVSKAPYNLLGGTVDDAGADVSVVLQQALNDAAAQGGGTVYVPAGIFRLAHPVTVPGGVELRGSWDVPHHTIGGGTVLFTDYGRGDEEGTLPALISLESKAGIRGLSVYYDEQVWNNLHSYAWTVRGLGHKVYTTDLTLINPYRGLDFGTHDTSEHYIDYLAGSPIKVGAFIGGGAQNGFVKNLQFNPHYYGRNPYKNFPPTEPDLYTYWHGIKETLDAIQVGDVSQQKMFNNFVFGAKYGIHFVDQNGQGPEAVIIGHGTDGSKKAVYIDAAGNTDLKFVNSELVTLQTPDKTYITLTDRFTGSAQFFNTSMWGDTIRSIDMASGKLKMQQLNITNVSSEGEPGVKMDGGEFILYNAYFQQANVTHVKTEAAIDRAELTNNLFKGGLNLVNQAGRKVTGTNILPMSLALVGSEFNASSPAWSNLNLKLTNEALTEPISGQIEWLLPKSLSTTFQPIKFTNVGLGDSINIPLPHLSSDTLKFKVVLSNGESYVSSLKLAQSFAALYNMNDAPDLELNHSDQYFSIGGGWNGTDDLSAATIVQWDQDNLYIVVKVKDDQHTQQFSNGDIWQGDSLQLGLDLSRKDGASSKNVSEMGFAVTNSGAVSKWRWRAPENVQPGQMPNVVANVSRDENQKVTTYDLKIPFAELHGPGYVSNPNDPIGLTFLLNDNDNGVRKGFMEFNKGIGLSKDSTAFGSLYLLQDSYKKVAEKSAIEAVKAYEADKSSMNHDAAVNFVALLSEGVVKDGLQARLAVATSPTAEPTAPTNTPTPTSTPAPPSTSDSAITSAPTNSPVPSSTPAPAKLTATPSSGAVNVKVKLDETTHVGHAVVSEELLNQVFSQIQVVADGSKTAVLNLEGNQSAEGYDIQLPSAFLASNIKNKIEIITPIGTMTISNDLLGNTLPEGASTFLLCITSADLSEWGAGLKASLGNYPAVEVLAKVQNQVVPVKGKVQVALSYNLSMVEAKHAHQLVIFGISDQGEAKILPNGYFDADSKQIVFTTSGYTRFSISLVDISFNDLKKTPWAIKSIEAMVARGLINGKSEGKFEPKGVVTRTELVETLTRMLGLSDKEIKAIAQGSPAGVDPSKQSMTRQDAITLIVRSLKESSNGLSDGDISLLDHFKDKRQVSTYAKASLAILIQAGIVQGSESAFRPKDQIIRAELSVILYNYLVMNK